jgi:hypothetical protein
MKASSKWTPWSRPGDIPLLIVSGLVAALVSHNLERIWKAKARKR